MPESPTHAAVPSTSTPARPQHTDGSPRADRVSQADRGAQSDRVAQAERAQQFERAEQAERGHQAERHADSTQHAERLPEQAQRQHDRTQQDRVQQDRVQQDRTQQDRTQQDRTQQDQTQHDGVRQTPAQQHVPSQHTDSDSERTHQASHQTSEHVQDATAGKRAAGKLEDEWQAVQYDFVDDPKAAVRKADQLVTRAIEELTARHRSLTEQLEGNRDPQTEDLRLALHRYRELFKSLVAVK